MNPAASATTNSRMVGPPSTISASNTKSAVSEVLSERVRL